ncbi:serine/threonine-protein kinase [Streptomyces sp. 5K101]|uniref:serine/threonine-protein kinase n=1 Tax=Streptomyces sp. 5K101 TaxID=3390037 RepID=UPI0039755726
MSEAEQSGEPQRDEAEGAGLAGKGEDSAVSAGGGSGDVTGGAPRRETVTAPQSSASDAGEASSADEPSTGGSASDAAAEDGAAGASESGAGEARSNAGDAPTPGAAVSGAAKDTGGAASGSGDAALPGAGKDASDGGAAAAGAAKDAADGDAVADSAADNGSPGGGAAVAGAAKDAADDDVAVRSAADSGSRDGDTAAAGARAGASGSGAAVSGAAKDTGGTASGSGNAALPADKGTSDDGAAAADKGASGAVTTGAGGGKAAGSGAKAPEGRLLAGRYRLGGVLGRGGMGTVWRAVDETLGRTVAVKELRFPNAIDEEEKRRLITRTLREAKAIARIRNNSAVTVYDVVDEDDRPWIVMELVEGKSLAEVVREDGILTPRRAAEVGLAILDVLRSAHREGILHRDVKPSNVLIGKDGRVVLTDFGIAQVEGDPSITSTGMLVGAPSYISPERARGHKPGPAADLWSLGGLLYASVEGCPPYDKGSAIATLTAVMTEPLDPPKNAGPLEEVIYGLLAKDPAQRLDDAGARALLTQVVNAPEAPVRTAETEAPVEQTRAIRIPPAPPVPPARPDAKPKDPAAERLRGALRSVRNAAAAAKAESRSDARAGTATTVRAPAASAAASSGRPAPVRAPLTDVVPRRTLVIIAIVAVLVVLSTVLVFALGGDDKANEGKGKGDTAASAGTTAGGDGKATAGADATPDSGKGTDKGDGQETGEDGGADDPAGDTGTPGGRPSGDGGGGGGGGKDALPPGYVMVSNDQFHFAMAMPEKFRFTGIAGRKSGAKFSVDGGVPRVQVDFTASPGDDAAAAWSAAVLGVRSSSNGYKHLGIRKVDYNDYPTVADWEFERTEKGQRVRILNRGFKVDAKHGYAIMITCKASEWNAEECETLRRTAFATFGPKD